MAFIVLQGCVPIPWVEKLPFNEEALAFIEPGVTDRDLAESMLGKPSAVRADSSLSFYDKQRLMALLVSQVGLEGMGTGHVLVIRYRQDSVIQSYEVLRLGMIPSVSTAFNEGCFSDELCIVDLPSGLAIIDRPQVDSEAKLFKRNENHCSVYLYYTDWSPLGSNSIQVCPFSDNSQSYAIYEGGYFHWLEEPGSIRVGANTLFQENDPCSTGYVFECIAGKQYFIHVHENRGIWRGNSVEFSTDNNEGGREAVLERRLMLR